MLAYRDEQTLPPCELSAGRPAPPPDVPGVSPDESVLRSLCPRPETLDHMWLDLFPFIILLLITETYKNQSFK